VEPASRRGSTATATAAQHAARTEVTASAVRPQTRVAVIGYGYWGPQLVRNFDRLRGSSVTHIVDLAADRREAAREAFPAIDIIADAEAVLGDDVDAVVIATPIRTHYALARRALEAGKHVFVEKPLTANVEQATELVALADRVGRVLMVGHTFMYNPAVEELRRRVQSGSLGRVYHVDAIRVNLGLFQPDINVLWDLAPHDLSILNYILDAEPVEVSAQGGAFVRPGVHDVAHVMLRYPTGALAHVHVSWLYPSKVRRITVVGDQQMAVYDDVESNEKLRIFNRGVDVPDYTSTFGEFQLSYRYGDIVSPHIHWTEPLTLECQHFLDSICTGVAPRSSGANGLSIVRLLQAMQDSLLAGGATIALAQPEGRDAH
jgi:predicted dehydrogenase